MVGPPLGEKEGVKYKTTNHSLLMIKHTVKKPSVQGVGYWVGHCSIMNR